MKRPLLCLAMVAALAGPALAEESVNKFSVQGDILIYDTETGGDDLEIHNDDVDTLLRLLRVTPNIAILSLNSSGGSVWAGDEMARIALDFELDTVVNGECSSSCVSILLAGARRTMSRGSKIGFHSRNWSTDAVRSYYEQWREDEGWNDPFDFASWVYSDTRVETYRELEFMLARGVEPGFAIKIQAPRDKMWYPTRNELRASGILTE